jgi:hypothetical protein
LSPHAFEAHREALARFRALQDAGFQPGPAAAADGPVSPA